jgi:hypothetical protein
MIELMALLSNKWIQRAGLVLALCIAILFARGCWIRQGKEQGKIEGRQAADTDAETRRAADRKETETRLNAFEAKFQVASQAAYAAQARADALLPILAELAKARQVGADQVAKLPDSDLHAYNVSKLAIRPPADPTPGYLPAEERAIAGCLTQYPLCQQERDRQLERTTEIQEQVKQLGIQVESQGAKYQELAGYTTRLEGIYTDLWNSTRASRRGARCLFLWKCSRPKIPAPNPRDLIRPMPKAASNQLGQPADPIIMIDAQAGADGEPIAKQQAEVMLLPQEGGDEIGQQRSIDAQLF